MNKFLAISLGCVVSSGLLTGAAAYADDGMRNYEVTVTNLTRGQSFTPLFTATHQKGVRLYDFGQPASAALAALAEGGTTAPMTALIGATPNAQTLTSGRLSPGQSLTVTIGAREGAEHFSVAAMMIPTNDTFIAVNGMPLPKGKEASVFLSTGHDAGSEPNDEICANIPGPVCHGEGTSANAGGEGFVHISAGIHGIGDLEAAEYDWRNPVARIVIRKIEN